MKIELRFAKPKTEKISKETKHHVTVEAVDNVFFKPSRQIVVSLLPIPEWLQNPACICGQSAKYLLEDATPICPKCVDRMLNSMNKKMKEIDTSIPITMDVITHSRFEWSTDNEKWYSIWGKNIKPDNPEKFVEEIRQAILDKQPILLECDYEKETKIMRVY
jgi:hypothetical protein